MVMSVKISKQVEKEIINLLHMGYSSKSITDVMKKKYKLQITNGEIIVIAKKMGIHKIGNRDINSFKDKMENISYSLPTILENDTYKNKLKKNLVLILLCLIILFVSIYLLGGLKIFVIALSVFGVIVVSLIMIVYFKYVYKNKSIREKLFKKNK